MNQFSLKAILSLMGLAFSLSAVAQVNSSQPKQVTAKAPALNSVQASKARALKVKNLQRTQGGVNGGGGDHLGQEFTAIGYSLIRTLDDTKSPIKVDLQELETAVRSVEVEFIDEELKLNGALKDAINYPGKLKIVVNENAWDVMSPNAKQALVLHEYLGIIGIEDATYALSYKMLNLAPEKFECSITVGKGGSENFPYLHTKIESRYDEYNDSPLKSITTSHVRLVGGGDVLKVAWDLRKIFKDDYYERSRRTHIEITAPEIKGSVSFSLDFDSENSNKHESKERNITNLYFTYWKKTFSGKIIRGGASNAVGAFPGPINLSLSTENLELSAYAQCRVR